MARQADTLHSTRPDRDIFPILLKNLAGSGGVQGSEIKYITHRMYAAEFVLGDSH